MEVLRRVHALGRGDRHEGHGRSLAAGQPDGDVAVVVTADRYDRRGPDDVTAVVLGDPYIGRVHASHLPAHPATLPTLARISTRASVLEFRAQRAADGVQVPQDLDVGVHETSLVVGDAVLLAERAHRLLGAPQAGPRHGGEQVVLDLVVQAAAGEVGEPPD